MLWQAGIFSRQERLVGLVTECSPGAGAVLARIGRKPLELETGQQHPVSREELASSWRQSMHPSPGPGMTSAPIPSASTKARIRGVC